ncbi:uncharacterized protein E0L32_006059 [Thyridium curvatum]|uniref:Killer toxin Kp4 domain-containing protein n=1 Tax=Thyridium curvatum TaxID=1093900 RepID=A0A507B9Y2_9PEZI|nr:uncharacterized protein E0L32_006059 [Thyridium curvatum]TPX13588.1 hypothetical protein E0L32_006059 [Thyridium curvatum]
MHLTQAHFLSVAALLGLFAGSSQGLGINCRGSGMCPTGDHLVAENLRNSINGAPDDKTFKKGDHIACDPSAGGTAPWIPGLPRLGGEICAFVQSVDSMTGKQVKALAQRIVDHGCKVCGSAPLDKEKNDVKYGQLTFNYVTKPKCKEGLC